MSRHNALAPNGRPTRGLRCGQDTKRPSGKAAGVSSTDYENDSERRARKGGRCGTGLASGFTAADVADRGRLTGLAQANVAETAAAVPVEGGGAQPGAVGSEVRSTTGRCRGDGADGSVPAFSRGATPRRRGGAAALAIDTGRPPPTPPAYTLFGGRRARGRAAAITSGVRSISVATVSVDERNARLPMLSCSTDAGMVPSWEDSPCVG